MGSNTPKYDVEEVRAFFASRPELRLLYEKSYPMRLAINTAWTFGILKTDAAKLFDGDEDAAEKAFATLEAKRFGNLRSNILSKGVVAHPRFLWLPKNLLAVLDGHEDRITCEKVLKVAKGKNLHMRSTFFVPLTVSLEGRRSLAKYLGIELDREAPHAEIVGWATDFLKDSLRQIIEQYPVAPEKMAIDENAKVLPGRKRS